MLGRTRALTAPNGHLVLRTGRKVVDVTGYFEQRRFDPVQAALDHDSRFLKVTQTTLRTREYLLCIVPRFGERFLYSLLKSRTHLKFE
jgi:hypothetical protein